MTLIIKIGFLISILGFILGGTGNKEFGIHIFVIGFFIIVIGFILKWLGDSDFRLSSAKSKNLVLIGFVIASSSFILSFYFQIKEFSEVIFYCGFFVILLGVSINFFSKKDNN